MFRPAGLFKSNRELTRDIALGNTYIILLCVVNDRMPRPALQPFSLHILACACTECSCAFSVHSGFQRTERIIFATETACTTYRVIQHGSQGIDSHRRK